MLLSALVVNVFVLILLVNLALAKALVRRAISDVELDQECAPPFRLEGNLKFLATMARLPERT